MADLGSVNSSPKLSLLSVLHALWINPFHKNTTYPSKFSTSLYKPLTPDSLICMKKKSSIPDDSACVYIIYMYIYIICHFIDSWLYL